MSGLLPAQCDVADRSIKSHDMLGMRLDYVTPDEYLPVIVQRAHAGLRGYCCVTNVHQCILVHDDREFRSIVNDATFVIPDSVILQKARSLHYGVPFQPTLKGADMMLALCGLAETQRVPIALIGGSDDTVLADLSRELLRKFPDLSISFAYSPPFRTMSPKEDEHLTQEIRQSGAKLIFVGLGCPKQELWMAAHCLRLDAMMIGVGAAFDFNAGVVRPSPEWVHRAGLEWLYRLASEPRRLWRRYLTTSPRFIWLMGMRYLGFSTNAER